jgi:outer membrane protein OmpA-like peptidoglycan-associated protein
MFYSAHFDYTQSTDFHDARIMNIYLNPISSNDYIELENVFFEHDSYVLDEKSKAELNQIILFLTLNKNMKVEIEGHTDNTGSKDYNQVLSEKRAKAICEYLSGTILNSRISYKGYGSEKPVATNSTPQGRSKNRRSEMRILSVD